MSVGDRIAKLKTMRLQTSRAALLAVLLAVQSMAFAQSNTGATGRFDPAPWLEDFQQLLSELSSHYANLDWAIEDRRMDLPRLREQTERKLRAATNEEDARRIFGQFLDSFGDGHLEIRWPKPQPDPTPSVQGKDLCDILGYHSRMSPGLDFSSLSGFRALDNEDSKLFPAGLLRLNGGKSIGILRIGLFSETAYPEACRKVVRQLGLSNETHCDDDCGNKVELATANLLTAAVVRQADTLRKAGASAVAVDITHNGGGSNWMEAPPRALSSVPLHDPRFAFIRHPHWTDELQDRLRDVQSDLDRRPSPTLQQAAATLQKAISESKVRCDRGDVWRTGKLPCALLVEDLLYTSGVLDYARPGTLDALESKTTLFHPSRYAYQERANQGPLYVIVDRNTWSAAEYFAVLLQDNHAATIVGELTGGAGCGYTNGGIPTKLNNSGAQVKMPDCARFRVDGSNEVNGITPDVMVPWADRDAPYQRVKKLQSALEAYGRKE